MSDIRGFLAAKLQCWHRLTGAESDELVALFLTQISKLEAKLEDTKQYARSETDVAAQAIADFEEAKGKTEALETELHHANLAATAEAHEVDRINAGLKALRKDAKRYQALRRMAVELSLSHQVISQFVTNQGELDAAIAEGVKA